MSPAAAADLDLLLHPSAEDEVFPVVVEWLERWARILRTGR